MDLTGPAGFGTIGTVTGSVNLYGNALLQFASGSLTRIDGGATLNLQTGTGFITAATSSVGGNSALTELSVNAGTFSLSYGAAVTTTAGGFRNTGYVSVDTYGPGGSSLSLGGIFTNAGTLSIGNGSIGSSTAVTATGLDNAGVINLSGNTTPNTFGAKLEVAGPAGFGSPRAVTGSVNIYGDSLLVFSSGLLTSVAPGATLNLQSSDGFIADAGSLTTNSALAGLSSNAGTFSLSYGAVVNTLSGTNFANSASLNLDTYGPGGSSLTLGGKLTNSGSLSVGNGSISVGTTLAILALENTGTINVAGNNSPGATEAALIVKGPAGFGITGSSSRERSMCTATAS